MSERRQITEAEWRAVDAAFVQRDKLFKEHGVSGADWDRFMVESAPFMNRIAELEDQLGPNMTEAEFKDGLMKWSRNWSEVLKRRLHGRKAEGSK